MDTSRISPTAHYTGTVWHANGLSTDALATDQGRRLHTLLRPFNDLYTALTGGPNLNEMLIQRHLILDHILTRAIASGQVSQVIEIAAGLSPRGWRFKRRFRSSLLYVEGDLPDMAALKRATLEEAGLMRGGHHVVTLNALHDDGPQSVAGVAGRLLDPSKGTAVITEGLINYFPQDAVDGIWRRIAAMLRATEAGGVYLSDMSLNSDVNRSLVAHAFRVALSAFARGSVHTPLETAEDARRAVLAAGFTEAALMTPAQMASEVPIPAPMGATRVRLLRAEVALPR
ncbi:MAG: hypothetical protein CMH57_12465 [Myxococcales bacterium]|nr:hypothetical protein [Myxococcales bacterium]